MMEQQKIIFSTNLKESLAQAIEACPHDRLFVLCDETTRELCLPVIAGFDCMLSAMTITIQATDTFKNLDFNRVKGIIDVEMSIPAQMRWDIDYAVQGRCPIHEVLRSGGQLLTNDQVKKGAMEFIKEVL